MLTDKAKLEKKEAFEKASRRAALLTLAGALIVAASLLFSFYQLNKLNNEIAEKQKRSMDLDQQLNQKQRELDYREQQVTDRQKELERYEQALAQVLKSVPKDTLNQTIKSNPQLEQVIEEVKNTPSTRATNSKDQTTALTKEREGFQALINGDYDRAIAAFEAAENAYNSFHNVFELARLIRRNKAQMRDPAKRKEVFQTIVKRYSYGAPPDLWQRVVSIANQ